MENLAYFVILINLFYLSLVVIVKFKIANQFTDSCVIVKALLDNEHVLLNSIYISYLQLVILLTHLLIFFASLETKLLIV